MNRVYPISSTEHSAHAMSLFKKSEKMLYHKEGQNAI